jgi:hypothetical protein
VFSKIRISIRHTIETRRMLVLDERVLAEVSGAAERLSAELVGEHGFIEFGAYAK